MNHGANPSTIEFWLGFLDQPVNPQAYAHDVLPSETSILWLQGRQVNKNPRSDRYTRSQPAFSLFDTKPDEIRAAAKEDNVPPNP